MKVAVVYNRESHGVINVFGVPNRERVGQALIKSLADALGRGGHQVKALEGDKDLVANLEAFMPRVVKGERPGLVFNISYGIQGQARYSHVPGILEMAGVPYVGSGPLAHSLALDKVVTKMILAQHGLPTPDFAVLDSVDAPVPPLRFPLIVKPRNEAVSFGLRVVEGETELREAVGNILSDYQPSVLVERYVEGTEVTVGLLGNGPPEALPPVMLRFGEGGPEIYTYEDKVGESGRQVELECPAPLDDETTRHVQGLAVKAFDAIGCSDCARVDMRIDSEGRPHILEINSLPSLGPGGSYVRAAAEAGLSFDDLANRLVEVASARYFGTPHPPNIARGETDPRTLIFAYLTERRDQLEKQVEDWIRFRSRTNDTVGLRDGLKRLDTTFREMALQPVKDLTDDPFVRTWETREGMDGGTLLMGHLDVPLDAAAPPAGFHRDSEWVFGEGVGVSRAPLVTLEFALRSLRNQRRLRNLPLGLLYYTDEGQDCRFSEEMIREATSRVRQVLVMRPGGLGDTVATQRRGRRTYRLIAEGEARRPGGPQRRQEVTLRVAARVEQLARLSSRADMVSVSVLEMHTRAFPMLLPHEVHADIVMTYLDRGKADRVERAMRELLRPGDVGIRWQMERLSDRPPMKERATDRRLAREMQTVAARWEIPLTVQSSTWPSAGGLAPPRTAVMCGLGPAARDLYTPQEAVGRISLVQRTLLLAQFLAWDMA